MHPTGRTALNRRLRNDQSRAFLEHELALFQIRQLSFVHRKLCFVTAGEFKRGLVQVIGIRAEVNT